MRLELAVGSAGKCWQNVWPTNQSTWSAQSDALIQEKITQPLKRSAENGGHCANSGCFGYGYRAGVAGNGLLVQSAASHSR